MSDILSKEEMESLVKNDQAEKKGDVSGRIVKPYDFHTPERFTKEHLRIFQVMTEDFSRRLRKHFSAQLRLEDLEITIHAIKQTTYKDFLSLPFPTYIGVFSMQPLDGKAAIEIEPTFLIFLIEYLLGGKNTNKGNTREMTQLEIEISSSLTNRILLCFSESFEKAVKFDARLETVENNAQFVAIASPNEACVLLTFEIKLKGVSGFINICLPYLVLESLTPFLNIKRWFMYAERKSDAEAEQNIKQQLQQMPISVVCKWGEADVTLHDLSQLQAGDYIRLGTPQNSNLELQVDGITKFIVQPGLIGRRLAVKVVSVQEL